MNFNKLHNIRHSFPTNKSWKFLCYVEIQTIRNLLYDFLIPRTNYIFFGFKLNYLHFGKPLYVFFFSLIFLFLQEIVESFMEFQNSNPLQRAPILGGVILYKFTNPKHFNTHN